MDLVNYFNYDGSLWGIFIYSEMETIIKRMKLYKKRDN